jgi:hypothetical protein
MFFCKDEIIIIVEVKNNKKNKFFRKTLVFMKKVFTFAKSNFNKAFGKTKV